MSRYHKWRGHAELILEDYKKNLSVLNELEQLAIWGNGGGDGMPRGSDVSDPVFRAVSMLDSPRMQVMRKEVNAVIRTSVKIKLRANGEEKAELMRIVWLERKQPLYAAAQELGVSYTTAKRWKREILFLIARELDWFE